MNIAGDVVPTGRIALLVVNYRTHDDVSGLLASVEVVLGDAAVQVVIVDNSEDDAEWQAVSGLATSTQGSQLEVRVIRADVNRGYAGGNNLAFSHIDPDVDVVAVVNPDCRFERGSLAELRTEVLRHGSAIHGARFTSIDNPESGVVAVDKMTGKIVWADRHVDLVETWRKIPYVAGHFFATTRATWEDIGGLSEDFFLFAEEADLAIRNGVTNSRVADAVEVSHSRGASMSKESGALRSDAALFHSARSSMILFRKHKTLRRRLPIVAVARVAWAGAVAAKSRPRDGLTVLAGQLAGLRHRVGTSAYEQYRGDAQNALGRDATTRKRTSVRPPVVHVTWQRHAGRAVEIAHALGGEALHVHPSGLSRRPLVPIRYALSLAATVGGLLRLRPLSVIVTNPPVFPGLAVAAYSTLARAPFVLDSHPGSFGVKGNVVGRRLLGVTRWLARRAAAVMVTVDAYVELVESWGARGLVVHEAPPLWQVVPSTVTAPRRRVLYVGVFADDEPVDEVVDAAALLPEVDFAITGDLARCPAALRNRAPANVEFVGFLGPDAYAAEFGRAHAIMSLTTEPTSIMRSAYEAVYARRPLVTSEWPSLQQVFPLAHHAANVAPALADAVRTALQDDAARLDKALALQSARWFDQLTRLQAALSR